MEQLCAPAIIYLIFSITQILIDTFSGLYNTALVKVVVMIMVTFLLQILCKGGLTIISWIIVFIPFILMTVIVSLLLYFFGLNATTGKINYTCKQSTNTTHENKDKNT
jgi:glucan phosphoethanolaminetransferase (alkaline phosphatase superfamily)